MNITKELEKMIAKLEQLGKENDYTLTADTDTITKLTNILENIFAADE